MILADLSNNMIMHILESIAKELGYSQEVINIIERHIGTEFQKGI